MELIRETKLKGAFYGFGRDKVFTFLNGQTWKQAKYKYKYKYKYRPAVKLWKNGSKYFLEFDCMDEMIEVKRVFQTPIQAETSG